MARSRALAFPRFGRPQVTVIRMPGRTRRAARAVGRVVRRGARRVASRNSIPITTAGIAAAGVGWLVGSGKLDFLPEIGGSKMVTLGAAGFLANRMSNNRWIKTAGFTAVVAAGFDWGRAQGAGGTHGDADWQWDT